jgi:quinol monooxygenase YgiN
MLIIAGWIQVDPAHRDDYLRLVADVTATARRTTGCLDFVQAADPIDADRIVIFERWTSEAELLAFRDQPAPDDAGDDLPPILGADVRRFEISGEGPP